jgi:hypothetical protein
MSLVSSALGSLERGRSGHGLERGRSSHILGNAPDGNRGMAEGALVEFPVGG